jgi:hypothetical protein
VSLSVDRLRSADDREGMWVNRCLWVRPAQRPPRRGVGVDGAREGHGEWPRSVESLGLLHGTTFRR